MTKIAEIAREAMELIAPEVRPRPEDEEVIARHKDELLGLTDAVVQAFYNALFAHPPTRAFFREGERPTREKTLSEWWKRTVEVPFDEKYWTWQAQVGLAHVRRGVSSALIMLQAFLVYNLVRHHASSPELAAAMGRLLATASAVIIYAYEKTQLLSVAETTGMSQELLRTNIALGVEKLLEG